MFTAEANGEPSYQSFYCPHLPPCNMKWKCCHKLHTHQVAKDAGLCKHAQKKRHQSSSNHERCIRLRHVFSDSGFSDFYTGNLESYIVSAVLLLAVFVIFLYRLVQAFYKYQLIMSFFDEICFYNTLPYRNNNT